MFALILKIYIKFLEDNLFVFLSNKEKYEQMVQRGNYLSQIYFPKESEIITRYKNLEGPIVQN